MPCGYGLPLGTASCLYEGPWHIHVPLAPYPGTRKSYRRLVIWLRSTPGSQVAIAGHKFANVHGIRAPPPLLRLVTGIHCVLQCRVASSANEATHPPVAEDAAGRGVAASGPWMARARVWTGCPVEGRAIPRAWRGSRRSRRPKRSAFLARCWMPAKNPRASFSPPRPRLRVRRSTSARPGTAPSTRPRPGRSRAACAVRPGSGACAHGSRPAPRCPAAG